MPDRLYVRVTIDTFSWFIPVHYTLKKSSFGDKSKRQSGPLTYCIQHLQFYAFPAPNLQQFPGVTKLLKGNIFVTSSSHSLKHKSMQTTCHCLSVTSPARHFKFEPFLPAETWVLWVFFSLWLIGKLAYTPSEQKTVCREEGNQCNTSHLSADFFISCN